jgi:hypothetical protein
MDGDTLRPGAAVPTRRRPVRGRRLLALVAFACACDVDFEATTRVEADGSVARVSRFTKRGSADAERVALPPGGSWQEREVTVLRGGKEEKETERVYTVARRFAPGEVVPADYLLRSEDGRYSAGNRIEVGVRDLGLVRLFEFEETYVRDGSPERPARLRELAVDLDAVWLDVFPSAFAPGWPGRTREEVDGAAWCAGGPYSRLAHSFRAATDPDRAIEDYARDFCRGLEGDAAGLVRIEACAQAVEAAADVDPELPEPDPFERDSNSFFETFFAPFEWTTDYSYRSRVELPGFLLSADPGGKRGDGVVWDFDPRGGSRAMRARSVLLLPGRIAAATLVALAVLLGLRGARRREGDGSPGAAYPSGSGSSPSSTP